MLCVKKKKKKDLFNKIHGISYIGWQHGYNRFIKMIHKGRNILSKRIFGLNEEFYIKPFLWDVFFHVFSIV